MNFKQKKWQIITFIILFLLIILNPSPSDFKTFTGIAKNIPEEITLQRDDNFLIFSIYSYHNEQRDYENRKYIAFLKNFIALPNPEPKSAKLEEYPKHMSDSTVMAEDTGPEKPQFNPSKPYTPILDTLRLDEEGLPGLPITRIKILYDTISQKFEVGSFQEFLKKMRTQSKRRILYNAISKDFYLGSFEDFEVKLGYLKIDTTEDGLPIFDEEGAPIPYKTDPVSEVTSKYMDTYADLLIAGDETTAALLHAQISELSLSDQHYLNKFSLLYTDFVIETEKDKRANFLSGGAEYVDPTVWSKKTQQDYDNLLSLYKYKHIFQIRHKIDSAMSVMAIYFQTHMPDKKLGDLLANMIANTKSGMCTNYYFVFKKQCPFL